MTQKAKFFILTKHFVGLPKESDFELLEEILPPIEEGEFLAEAVYLSVDPYMRALADGIPLNSTMIGAQVAKITDSKNYKYPVGRFVVAHFGWRSHTVVTKDMLQSLENNRPMLIPDMDDYPPSLALGVLGMPGNTAYFGFLEICQPKQGETIVVSGAAGAVGSHVGQIAKIKGCKVIGISGSDEKNTWLKSIGFDHVINYKTQDISEALKLAAPEGVDCYFDNVGGELSSTILNCHMNSRGRVSVCGSISAYNDDIHELSKATNIQRAMNIKQTKMEGFIVYRWSNRWMEGINQNLQWLREGKLQYHETITEGFENMVQAFIGILEGKNIGKAIVKV